MGYNTEPGLLPDSIVLPTESLWMMHNGDAVSYSPKKHPERSKEMRSRYRGREQYQYAWEKQKSKIILSPKPKSFRSFMDDIGVAGFVPFIFLLLFRGSVHGIWIKCMLHYSTCSLRSKPIWVTEKSELAAKEKCSSSSPTYDRFNNSANSMSFHSHPQTVLVDL